MMWIGIGVCWCAGGAFVVGLCRAAAAGDRAVEVALATERRQVGVCGSCGGPIMLDPEAAVAACPCGHCVLPRKFLRYGESERAHG